MKTVLVIVGLLVVSDSFASGNYQCKVDARGVMVCYPKPRGF